MRLLFLASIVVAVAGCGVRSQVGLAGDHAHDGSAGANVDARGGPDADGEPEALGPEAGGDGLAIDTAESGGRDAGRPDPTLFCGPMGSLLEGLDVWSDDRGVFVLTSQSSADEVIQLNSGSGWREVYRAPKGSVLMNLAGFTDGPLVLYGAAYGSARCGIRFVDGGASYCSAAASFAASVHTVRSDLAYAVQVDRVLGYHGNFWTQVGDPLQPAGQVRAWAIWSNGDVSLVAATLGHVFVSAEGGAFTPQTGVPTCDFRSAWGFANADLWVGDSCGNLVHGDGVSWTVVWTDSACGGRRIAGMWGMGGTLYFRTSSSVGFWDGTRVQTVVDLGCNSTAEITGLWGNSPTEVYFTVRDSSQTSSPCGEASVMRYDGVSVRSL
jgi:hypothetical protein